MTREIAKAGRLLEIELLDHLVVGQPNAANRQGWVSLKQRGLLG